MSSTNDIKPGETTTEFWLSIMAVAVGAVLILFGAAIAAGLIKGNENAADVGNNLVLIGASLVGVTSAGYSASRGIAKLGGSKNGSSGSAEPLDTDSIFE